MGAASSKVFVNQMLRNSVDDANDIFAISGDNAALDSSVNNYEQEFLHAQLEDYENDEDDARTNLLLGLVVHHANVQCLKRKKLLMLKVAELRRRQGARLPQALSDKKTRTAHPRYFTDPISGVRCRMTPKLSLWWVLYIQDPKPECRRWSKSFRQRFRMPYHSFIKILDMMHEEDNDIYFRRWKSVAHQEEDQDRSAPRRYVPPRKVSPIELLLLGTLRYLGRGWTFDDLEESTFISRDVHRCFFHHYCAFGAQKLYPLYIKRPNSLQDMRACEKEYRDAGFPGCIGSTDATHIPLERVSCRIRQGHLGYKMSCTARTYNLTVNHRRQILHSTTGHPGRWNDKTLIRFDSFMMELQKGALNSTMSFELRKQRSVDAPEETAATTTTIKGAYVIVDNGYLNWSTTVPPMKNTCNRSEIRFSQWLESLRKDVECTFGILKGRWRVLKSGIRVHNTEAADNMWLTCCALHNMLLDVDGLSVGWQNGVPSHWELQIGQFQDDEIPAAIRRLLSTEQVIRSYDRSSCGYNPASTAPFSSSEEGNGQRSIPSQRILAEGEAVAVNELPLSQFRAMLIENFNVLFHEQKIAWPKRLAGATPRHVPDPI